MPNQGLQIALESNNERLFAIVFHNHHEKTFKNIGETFQNQTPDSPFAELVVRRNHHSSDSNSITLRKATRVILAGFVLAVRPGKELVRQLAKEKLKLI